MTPKEIYAIAEKMGLLYTDDTNFFSGNRADNRHRSRLINFANEVLKASSSQNTELKDQDENYTGPEKA